jgi:hypothetical protein
MTDEKLSTLIAGHFEPTITWHQKRADGRDALSDGGYHWCEWHHVKEDGSANPNHIHPVDFVNNADNAVTLLPRLNPEDRKMLSRTIAECFAGNKGLL